MKKLLLIICMLYLPFAEAKDYGVFGKTFEIAEIDFLEYIQQKMKGMQVNGEWKTVQSEFKKRVKEHVARPTPIRLPRAEDNRTWFFNPSLAVPYDVKDSHGQVIVKQGTVINPLDRVGLSSTLLFFDGDDEAQVAWVTQELTQHQKVKLILTSGSVKEVANQLKQAIYFDLNGFLVAKFQIKYLPARVFQAGKRLQINEVTV
ncbi:TPA: type-F conjugative transfer system protein TraW [Legionella pneumophila]|uniref:TraW n=4 Tax=Legionella TaxID=445 RepID=Q5ZTS5_LEGPH|nr:MULTISPECIES: type-F conjugative transfer system protein TraW [Legionella]WBV63964.1 type-F conjugative transfer system protein TraW [Legionella pneumophila 130b]AAU28152.1 TraW [Legionella pneumophila subsp. pneumophila str. Philadelphia 1]AEW52276.1 TraW [Legionella pneumophila subsp. pneumophila ATCC 43290]AGH53111.1 IncF plasmid conjugative transfer pilus assembly protein TraW [Legionella pneumophila subsp. pneumophila LPE509]AGN15006.1 conjugal transfer pilus assembly protein TraW [Leg